MTPITIVIIALLALGLIVASILLLRRSEEDPLSARIVEYALREEPASMEEIELSLPFSDRVIVPMVRRVSQLVTRLTPQTTLERTARQLEVAGSPRNMTAAEILGHSRGGNRGAGAVRLLLHEQFCR
jgi:tight adherence protein C